MTTLTIEIPEKVQKTLTDLVEQLGGKVIKTNSKELDKKPEKLSRKEKEYLKGLEEAVEFVNLHQRGKVKAKTIDQFLNEL
ncbi:hypothetical protein ACPPVU_21840 [Mucilaginibacter sp. McL0603]|uniref:hypothetical protein n=1 Tax=Mucilaginibacter sp. McL0603 TaxID=3415670 RepID=UPI003CF30BB9